MTMWLQELDRFPRSLFMHIRNPQNLFPGALSVYREFLSLAPYIACKGNSRLPLTPLKERPLGFRWRDKRSLGKHTWALGKFSVWNKRAKSLWQCVLSSFQRPGAESCVSCSYGFTWEQNLGIEGLRWINLANAVLVVREKLFEMAFHFLTGLRYDKVPKDQSQSLDS